MSDGQFSSKPMRSGRPRDADEFTADSRLLTDAGRAFVQAPAVRNEINALTDYPLPATGPVQCAPLHKNTPEAALDMGRPLASAVLVQEYLIGLIFLRICGWIFMAFGALFLIGAFVTLAIMVGGGRNPNPREPNPFLMACILSAFGLGIGGVGAWFGIFRGRVIDEMCWFCSRGMIWRTGSTFDWYTWEEVREVYCRLDTARPAIAIRFDANLSVISFSNTHLSRMLVDYIESRASAACAPLALQQIADGRSIRFGDWRLSRMALLNGDTEIDWRDVDDVWVRERQFHIRRRDGGNVMISLDDVPFPKMFIALVRGIHAYSRAG